MRFSSITVAVLPVLFFAVFCARDASALTFDRLQITPSLDFSTAYDDNIFALDSNRVDDFYFQISPALLLKYGRTKNKLELEYGADIYRYIDTGDANNAEDQHVRAAAELNFSRLYLKFNDILKHGHETRSEENPAIISITQLNKYLSNDFNAEFGYAFSERFRASLAYDFYLVGYTLDTSKFRDLYKHEATASVFYAFMPKTSALIQGTYTRADHYNTNASSSSSFDSNEYWALGGITWDITAKSTGTVKGGYEWKVFDNPGSRNFSSPVFMVSLDHNFTPKTSIRVSGQRQAQETDDPLVSYYTSTNGTLGMVFKPFTKVEINPKGSIAYNKYSGPSLISGESIRRVETVANGGIDVQYHMNKWFTISADYKHTKRSSTITLYDYTDNMAIITLKASI